MGLSGALALLRRHRQFRALWGAVALSYIGSGAANTALTLYVQQTRGTGTAVAAFLIASIGGVLSILAVAPTLLRAPAPTVATRST
jgi:Na+/melibiose symporter-like transporter